MRDPTQTGATMPQPPPKLDYSQLYGWIGLMLAVLVFLGLTWDTALHHFAVGLLMAVVVLLVFTALFEGLWWAALRALRNMGVDG